MQNPQEIQDILDRVGESLRTQNNRGTADPIWELQVLERTGPFMVEFTDNLMFYDSHLCEVLYPDDRDPSEYNRLKELHEKGELPDHVQAGGYKEEWKPVAVFFTQDGYDEHMALNSHNYRHYHGVRSYVNHLHRNPEMVAIRDYLKEPMKSTNLVSLDKVLDPEELAFMEAVMRSDGGKIKDASWGEGDRPLWTRLEEMKLISPTGSYSWIPTTNVVLTMPLEVLHRFKKTQEVANA